VIVQRNARWQETFQSSNDDQIISSDVSCAGVQIILKHPALKDTQQLNSTNTTSRRPRKPEAALAKHTDAAATAVFSSNNFATLASCARTLSTLDKATKSLKRRRTPNCEPGLNPGASAKALVVTRYDT